MAEPVLQSSLGRVKSNSTKRDRKQSTLAVGKVVNVHPKCHTADVVLLSAGGSIYSSSQVEGRYSCRICTPSAGYDTELGKSYGVINPIEVGETVLIGFVEGQTGQPVIISPLFDDSSDAETILNQNYEPSNMLSSKELYRRTHVTRSQDAFTIDGVGNFEVSSHTRAFFVGQNANVIDEDTYNFEQLFVSDVDQSTKTSSLEGKMKFIAGIETPNGYLKMMVDARTGQLKFFQQAHGSASIIEIDKLGNLNIRKHMDTTFSDKGESKKYAQISLTDKGSMIINIEGEKKTKFTISPTTVEMETDNNIKVKAKKDIYMETTEGNFDIKTTKGNTNITTSVGNTTVKTKGNTSIKTDGDTTISTKGNNNITADGKNTITAKGDATIKANGNLDLESGGNTTIKASNFEISAPLATLNGIKIASDGDSTTDGASVSVTNQ